MKAKRKEKSKKGKLRFWVIPILLLLLVWFWYIQNFTFTVNKTDIPSGKVTTPVRIVQISDLHGATFGRNNRKLVASVKRQKPDLICVTGDMYTRGDTQGMDVAVSLMKDLTEVAPVYFVPGEHDQDQEYLNHLEGAGVSVISYEKTTLTVAENQVTLYGIDNVYYTETFNLFREFDEPSKDSLNLLLAHIPNFEAFNWFGPDLTLCGDTHGGVVQLPLVGPLYFNGQWLPELTSEEEYITDKGLFKTFTGYVYVNGGLGNYPYPVRFFNRPEVSVVTIVPEEG